jgi:hypothetical protein
MKIAFVLTTLCIPLTIEGYSWSSSSDAADDDSCTVYLAPSTIEGAGQGIFTSVARENNTVLGLSDVIVPIYDLRWHHPDDDYHWIFTEYVWDGIKMMGMHADTENALVDAYAPGLDCAINCHLGLLNVDRGFPSYDTTTLPHRSEHPAAGSMTAYYNCSTFTTTDLPAGAELFKYYGDHWFTSRDHFSHIPLTYDYQKAGFLLDKMHALFENRLKLSKEAQRDLYKVATTLESRILNALPPTFEQLEGAVTNGLKSVSQPNHMRDNLKDMPEARCLENIVPRQSAIKGASRGGFAARSFNKDETITGSPLLHVPDKEVMNLYHWDSKNRLKDPDRIVGKQLVLNYCWGHGETDLLLCPYGSGVNFINHSRQKANVKIQWAPNGHIGQDDSWFDWSLRRMRTTHQPNLAWDYIALRKITEGEELFIDYGDDWVSAWGEHVANWKPSKFKDYKSAAEWNEAFKDDHIKTSDELMEIPYPLNVFVVCHTALLSNTYHIKQRKLDADQLWDISMDGIGCRIVERKTDTKNVTNYTVEVHTERFGSVLRSKVDRKMFRFRDVTYSTDTHLPGAFRQPATIPDDLLPPAWRTSKDQHEEL